MLAAAHNHIPVVRELLAAGADVNQEIIHRTEYPENEALWEGVRGTALYYASLGGNDEMARILLDAGADINHRVMQNYTNLFVVYQCVNAPKRLRTMRLFLERGMDATPTFNNERTLLMKAIIDQHPLEEIRLLIPYQDLSARDSQGFTALNHAHRSHREDVARLLTEQGALPGTDLAQRAAARPAERQE